MGALFETALENRVQMRSLTPAIISTWVLTMILAFYLVHPVPTHAAGKADDLYAPIKKRLVQDGFSPQQAGLLFQSQPAPLFKLVSKTLIMRESKLNYDQFLEASSLMKAQRFLREYQTTLAQAEAKYGVDRNVIVAILLVETQFGSYTGKTPTLAILSTFALMGQEKYRDKVWTLLPPEERKRWGREPFDQKLKQRSEWAYQELCALARLMDKHTVRVDALQGSVMGAVGWPQFLPSSLVKYGVDGNVDGRIDLFQPTDAIFSAANYLRGYGWCEAKTRAEKEDVIHHYNKSRPYVNAVLGVADRLTRMEAKPSAPN